MNQMQAKQLSETNQLATSQRTQELIDPELALSKDIEKHARPDIFDPRQDEADRRIIRSNYRDLLHTIVGQ